MSVLNLLIPGLGLVLCGRPVTGMVIGAVFALCANLAIAGAWLYPEDIGRSWVLLAAGAACGAYVAAQLQMTAARRAAERRQSEHVRRLALRQAAACLAQGAADEALTALRPLAGQEQHDLLVAVRRAQALLLRADPEAGAAWRCVQRLDRHGVYRAELAAAEQRLGSDPPEVVKTPGPAPSAPGGFPTRS